MKEIFDLPEDFGAEEWTEGEENTGESRFVIRPEDAGNRADAVLASYTGLSRSAVQRYMEEGQLMRLV